MTIPSIPTKSIDSLIRFAKQQPKLSRTDELTLFSDYRKGDQKALERIILAQVCMVAKIANKLKNYGLPLEDMVQEGMIGLLESMDDFDTAAGFRFSTYAVYKVRRNMFHYAWMNARISKPNCSKAQRKLFYKYKTARKTIGNIGHAEAQEIAKDLNVGVDEVYLAHQFHFSRDFAIDQSSTDGDGNELNGFELVDENCTEPLEWMVSMEKKRMLSEQLGQLSENAQKIIHDRFLAAEPKTLKEIGLELGCTTQNVHKVCNEGIAAVKHGISKQA